MPNSDTFSIKPIGDFVKKHLFESAVSFDPFARNCRLATHTNDLNPDTCALHHMDAEDFCKKLYNDGVRADLLLFDPPYSPRQISECYSGIGRAVTGKDTQNAALYKRVRDAAHTVLKPGGKCLSFGWNSNGMGKTRGYEILEILIVAHGGGHNDTICMAEIKTENQKGSLL